MPRPSFRLSYDRLVPRDGYRWIDGEAFDDPPGSKPRRFLVDVTGPADGRRRRLSKPLIEHTGLFREFADTPVSEEGIKAFADRNGDVEVPTLVVLGDAVKGVERPSCMGEDYTVWRNEIGAMRQCVVLTDAVRDEDLDTLSKHIIWRDAGVFYESKPGWEPAHGLKPGEIATFAHIATQNSRPYLLEKFERGDLVKPALSYVQKLVNERLGKHTSLRMFWSPELTEMQNFATPKNMLGSMWLQLAMAMESKNSFRRCEQCGKWFEVARHVARADKIFCSPVCRLRAFRQRKAEEAQNDDAGSDASDAGKRNKRPHWQHRSAAGH